MNTEKRWAFMSRKVIGRQDNPMLIRWRLIQTPWFGIYLHFIHREDLDRLPHDHPWTFRSFVLRGQYMEEFWPDVRLIGRFDDSRRVRSFGRRTPRSLLSHKIRGYHRFDQGSAHRITDVRGKVTTLVLVGRKARTWGFYDGVGNFIDWRDYHALANGWSDVQRHEAMRQRIRTCRACGCTENDCTGCIERTGVACSWVADDLCSACGPHSQCRMKSEIHLPHPVSDNPGEPWCQGVRDPDVGPGLHAARIRVDSLLSDQQRWRSSS